MSVVTVGAAQLGPIAQGESRGAVVKRLVAHLHEAKARGCDLEVDAFFEREMPGPETRPLFDEARRLGLAFCLGYAELTHEDGAVRHFNTAILVDRDGRRVGTDRKIHLPGHAEHEPARPFQNLEKRYFDVGNLGFGVWRGRRGQVRARGRCGSDRPEPDHRSLGCRSYRSTVFDFARHRRPEHYRLIVERTGAAPPA